MIKWFLFYLVFNGGGIGDLEPKVYIHWLNFTEYQECKEEETRLRLFDNVSSAWCEHIDARATKYDSYKEYYAPTK
jgi:hypothetical protein